MPTPRSVPAGVVREIERSASADHILVFLVLNSSELASPIRVVSGTIDHVYGGDTYQGFPFKITLVTDTDSPPGAMLTIQNADRQIGDALRKIRQPVDASITCIAGSEFDNTVNPRTEIGVAATIYQATGLRLVEVDVNAMEVTGRLVTWDVTREQWPGIMSTQDRLPGLFRS